VTTNPTKLSTCQMLSTFWSFQLDAGRLTPSVLSVRSRPDPMSRVAVLRRPAAAAVVAPPQDLAKPSALTQMSRSMTDKDHSRETRGDHAPANPGGETAPSPNRGRPTDFVDVTGRQIDGKASNAERIRHLTGKPADPTTVRVAGRHHSADDRSIDDSDDTMDGEYIDDGVDIGDQVHHADGPNSGRAEVVRSWAADPNESAADPAVQPTSPAAQPCDQLDSLPSRASDLRGTFGGWVPERRSVPVDGDGPHRGYAVPGTTAAFSMASVSAGQKESDDHWHELPAMPIDTPMHANSAGPGRHTRPSDVGNEPSRMTRPKAGRTTLNVPEDSAASPGIINLVDPADDDDDEDWPREESESFPPANHPDHPPARARRVGRHWGRFAELWVPESLREARVDPGRRGAIVLLLIAAVAATVTAVGVWRDRPESRPVETSAISGLAITAAGGGAESAQSLTTTKPGETVSSTGPEVSTTAPATEIVVSVTGLVANPGLVTLRAGARVADAIAAAGGTGPDADLTGMNLAARLSDGDSVVIGSSSSTNGVGSVVDSAGMGGSSPDAAGSSGASNSGLINLNTADEAALDTLPGVGPVMAQNILAWRETNGSFTSIEQLQEITGIGPSRYAQISPLVTVS